MADFKLDDNIPLPEPDPSEELDRLIVSADDPEDDEDPEIPGKRGRKPRCSSTDKHVWESLNDREDRCRLCYEIFPCLNEAKCWHVDCWEARGKVHPWIVTGVMTPKSHAWHAGVCLYCHNLQDSLDDTDYPCTGLPETELCLAPDD
jgi:hypothetical protein